MSFKSEPAAAAARHGAGPSHGLNEWALLRYRRLTPASRTSPHSFLKEQMIERVPAQSPGRLRETGPPYTIAKP
jgi:hypothetical protein